MTFLSVTDAARKVGCRPRDISDAFYNGYLDDAKVVRVANRRAIPVEYLSEIHRVLTERGKLQEVL